MRELGEERGKIQSWEPTRQHPPTCSAGQRKRSFIADTGVCKVASMSTRMVGVNFILLVL